MFCPGCGNKLEENAKFCASCGRKIEDNVNEQTVVEEKTQTAATSNNINNEVINNNEKPNGFAIAGFVISLVSMILCCGTISWLSLIFSIIGVVNANKENGKGKGLAIAGIIISALSILILIILYILGLTTSFMDKVETNGIGTFS